MKKVLQIVDYVFPGISGIGETAMDIANTLKIQKYCQKIICINSDANRGGLVTKHEKNSVDKVKGVDIIRCRMDLHIASQPISFSYIYFLNKIMKEFKPDIVIFHYPNPFLAEFMLHYKKDIFKLIIWWHSDIIKQKILGKFFIKQNLELLKRASKVVATSPNYINGSKYLKKFEEKCVVLPSCVREDELVISNKIIERANEIKPKGKIMCFSLGRHVKYKGFEYLIEAAKRLDDRFVFYIGGTGPLSLKLKELANGDSRFHFTGYLEDDELQAFYYATDIFCFPSITKNEAFGLALADAMYYGKAAVTFHIDGSGVGFVNLDGVTGIECENKNVEQYAKALEKLANDEVLRNKMGENGHERVMNNFSYSVFKKNIKKLFESI